MTIEKRLSELERHIKTRRGANRRAAYAALYTADALRALATTESLAHAAGRKNKIELGGVLASTGIPLLSPAEIARRAKGAHVRSRAWLLHATFDDVLVSIERGPDLVMEALRLLLPRSGRYAMAILAAIDRVDR